MQKMLLIILLSFASCQMEVDHEVPDPILPGAHQLADYLPMVEGRKVALTVNHSSLIDSVHLIKKLQQKNIDIEL